MYTAASEDDEQEKADASDTDATSDAQRRVAVTSHVDKLWDDMNVSTAVSKNSVDKTAKVPYTTTVNV